MRFKCAVVHDATTSIKYKYIFYWQTLAVSSDDEAIKASVEFCDTLKFNNTES